MLSSQTELTKLSKLQKLGYYIPHPCHKNNKQESMVIISTHSYEDAMIPGVYEYNLETNKLKLLCEYQSYMEINDHTQFIDHENESLYIITTEQPHYVFNLKTNKFEKEFYIKCDMNSYLRSIKVFKNVYFMDKKKYIKFNICSKKIEKKTKLKEIMNFDMEYPKHIFISSKKSINDIRLG